MYDTILKIIYAGQLVQSVVKIINSQLFLT